MADIDRMHRLRGFLKVGYHFVIKRSGLIEPGRPLDERGAHVEGYNSQSIGICLIGGVDSKLKPQANFTPEQMAALRALLDTLGGKYPQAVVLGHRDFPNVAKACPSMSISHWLKTGDMKA